MYTFKSVLLILCMLLGVGCATNKHAAAKVEWGPECHSLADQSGFRSTGSALLIAVVPKAVGVGIDYAAAMLKEAGQSKDLVTYSGSEEQHFYQLNNKGDLEVAKPHRCLRVTSVNTASRTGLSGQPSFLFEARVEPLSASHFQLIPHQLEINEFGSSSLLSPRKRDFTIAVTFITSNSQEKFASTVFTFSDMKMGEPLKPGDRKLEDAASEPLPFPLPSPVTVDAKKRQAAAIAPYVLADDVLTKLAKKTSPKPPTQPVPTAARNYAKAVATFCSAIQQHNRDFPNNPLTDPRCALNVKLAEARLQSVVDEASTPKALESWAKSVCPAVVAPNGVSECHKKHRGPISRDDQFDRTKTKVVLTESRGGSKLAKAMGDILGSSKDGITEVSAGALIPSEAKKLSEAEDAEERATLRAVKLADLKVQLEEQKLAEAINEKAPASQETSYRVALFQAQAAANDAYRRAKLPVPYPDLY